MESPEWDDKTRQDAIEHKKWKFSFAGNGKTFDCRLCSNITQHYSTITAILGNEMVAPYHTYNVEMKLINNSVLITCVIKNFYFFIQR